MKSLLIYIFLLLKYSAFTQEVNKVLTITASGLGKTFDEAKQSAFRSAIDQSIGTLNMSNSENILDTFRADSVSSFQYGSINSYTILSKSELPNGNFGLTIKALVSITKLITFLQNNGITVEIRGNEFANNIKQQILNEESEIKVITDLVGFLHEPMQISFDYKIKVNNPKSIDSESEKWIIPITVSVVTNKNIETCNKYFFSTLMALSLNDNDIKVYKNLNKPIFHVSLKWLGTFKNLYFRKQASVDLINVFLDQWNFYNGLFSIFRNNEFINPDFKSNISPINIPNPINNSVRKTINLFNSGQQTAQFYCEDERSLTQIQNLDNYKIVANGIVSKFKFGGFVVYEHNGHGLVCSVLEMKDLNWFSSQIFCKNLNANYYTDWRMPSRNELKDIYFNLVKKGVGGFDLNYYWSSTETYDQSAAWKRNLLDGNEDFAIKTQKLNTRAVRTF